TPVLESSGFVPYCLVRRARRLPGRRKKTAQSPLTRATITAVTVPANGQSKAEAHRNGQPFTVTIERRGSAERISHARGMGSPFDFFDEENSPDRFMTGYGTTRRVEMAESVDPRSQKRRIPRYQRVAGLFEEYIALMPLGTWLASLKADKPRRYHEIVQLI